MEKKVNLTTGEFLSLYTGWLFGPSFDTVTDACEKVFGFSPYTLTTTECANQFRKAIDKNRPELAAMVKSCGEMQKGRKDEFMKAFEEKLGSDTVEVSTQKYQEKTIGM
ncbi:MAG: hypothetical protein IJ008_04710 [Clostridia bacterium]|nr:hypothetical protein [Clostridia bacterium]